MIKQRCVELSALFAKESCEKPEMCSKAKSRRSKTSCTGFSIAEDNSVLRLLTSLGLGELKLGSITWPMVETAHKRPVIG